MNNLTNYQTYQSPFTWRYGSESMRIVFSERHKYEIWRSIWIALAKVEHKAGLVTKKELDDLIIHQKDIDIDRILELEKDTKHDVVAAIKEFAEKCPIGGGKIHFGATSMDIVDNTEMIRMKEGLVLVEEKAKQLLDLFCVLLEEYADTPCMGYTHLQPAEPTTVGYRLAFYAQDLLTDLHSLQSVKLLIKSKGMKGAVGTRASYQEILEGTNITADILDTSVMADMGIEGDIITSQVYSRKYDYLVGTIIASIASSLSKFAADLRILQSPLFGEMSEPFGPKQVGSSAMPFKKNPINSEKICSLARYIQNLPQVLLENASLSYLERTLDDSANRRIVISELFLAIDEILITTEKVIKGLVINTERIAFNLEQYGPFAATESLLIAAVKKGANRQEMHELLRTISLEAWQEVHKGNSNPMINLLKKNSVLLSYLSLKEIDQVLDVTHHIGDSPERVKKLITIVKKTVK